MLDDLYFNGEVNDFMEKVDDTIEKIDETKSMLVSDEKEPVVMMGETAKVEDIKDEI